MMSPRFVRAKVIAECLIALTHDPTWDAEARLERATVLMGKAEELGLVPLVRAALRGDL